MVTQHVPSPVKEALLLVSGEKRWECTHTATNNKSDFISSAHSKNRGSIKGSVGGQLKKKTLRDAALLLALSMDASLPVRGHVTRRAHPRAWR